MPTYEYECSKCHDHFEIEQKITAKKLTKCAKCKGKLERLLSATPFALKGGGWYKDGYSRPGTKTESKASAGESSPPAAKPTPGKTDK